MGENISDNKQISFSGNVFLAEEEKEKENI